MATIGFNALWALCVLLLLFAFFLAVRRRRLACKAEANRNLNPSPTTYIRHNRQEVRIHMPTSVDPPQNIQPPPPAFDSQEPRPPPSYQDFRKDVQIQP